MFQQQTYNKQTPLSHQNCTTNLRFMYQCHNREALHLKSFVLMYCALKVSEFRLLNLGRPSEIKKREKIVTIQREKKSKEHFTTLPELDIHTNHNRLHLECQSQSV